MTQQFHSWVYIEKKQKHYFKNIHAPQCTIAKVWKQPKCPSADEWIKNIWYIYTMESYSAIKKN